MELIPQDPNFDPVGFWTSDIYGRLVRLGDALWPATQYGNRYVVDDDVRSQALLKLGLAGYYQSLAPCIQLEKALLLSPRAQRRISVLRNDASLYRTCGPLPQGCENREAMDTGSGRGCVAGRGATDKAHYDNLSAYNHGDFTWHALLRRESYVVNQKNMLSTAITQWDELLQSLRSTLGQDVEWITTLLGPFIRRMSPKVETTVDVIDEGQIEDGDGSGASVSDNA